MWAQVCQQERHPCLNSRTWDQPIWPLGGIKRRVWDKKPASYPGRFSALKCCQRWAGQTGSQSHPEGSKPRVKKNKLENTFPWVSNADRKRQQQMCTLVFQRKIIILRHAEYLNTSVYQEYPKTPWVLQERKITGTITNSKDVQTP